MNDVILKAKDFKNLHNAICDLERLNRGLTPRNKRKGPLDQGLSQISEALADIYRQNNVIDDRKIDHYNQFKQKCDFSSTWSMYEVTDMGLMHKYQYAHTVRYAAPWGRKTINVPIDGICWVDLWAAADKAIAQSGDDHHVFIEDFQVDKKDNSILLLSTGS
jgi:hypothetical protein